MKKFIIVVLLFIFILSTFSVNVLATNIDDSSVFIKQTGGDWCTYAATTNMLRRRAILDGHNSWSSFTDTDVRNTSRASGGGMLNSFSYAGYGVKGEKWDGKSTDQKKSTLISMLSSHPEGIVIYTFGGANTHAVLLCKYSNGTFYVADPSSYKPAGLIKLTEAQFNGSSQDERIGWVKKVWYINSGSGSGTYNPPSTSPTPNPSPRQEVAPSISVSEDIINLDWNSRQSQTITLTVNGNVPSNYHLNINCDNRLTTSWGGWNKNSTTLTVSMQTKTVSNAIATITLLDSNDNVYATKKITINANYPSEDTGLELSTTTLGIDHINNPKASVSVHISGDFPDGGSLDVKNGSGVTTEWTDYDGRNATLIINANWRLAENDEVVTVRLLDANKNVLTKESINVYSSSQKHLVEFNANGGNNAPNDLVKWKGSYITIPYEIPEKNGYKFLGWSKSQYANAPDYECGDRYNDDIDVVLYAVWEGIDYDLSLSFDYYKENTNDCQILHYKVYGDEHLISDVKFDCDDNIECAYYVYYDRFGDCGLGFTFKKIGRIKDSNVIITLLDNQGNIITQEELSVFGYADRNTDGITVYINGKKIAFDVEPIIINGRTMVPMRKIFEELGAIVGWNDNSQVAFGSTSDTLVQIGIGKDYLSRNGEKVYLDSPAIIMSGRTLVPARAIAESLNCKVEWLGEYQIVEITKENIQHLPKRTELRIGWCEYAPINYRDDNGKLIGFDTELAEYVCEFWGWKPTFVEIDFDQAFPSIMNGRVDCYWNGITATEERAEKSTFTNVYLETDVDYEDVDGEWCVSHEMYSVPFQKDDYLTVYLTNIALEVAKADGTIDHLKYKYGLR